MRLVVSCLESEPRDLLAEVARSVLRLATAEGRPGARTAESPPGWVEARLDGLRRPATPGLLEALARGARGRLLATCRPGGPGSPTHPGQRLELLEGARRAGAAGLDVESDAVASFRDRFGPSCAISVISHHLAADGAAPSPAAAARLVDAMAGQGADVVKLAAPAGSAGTALQWMDAALAAGRDAAVAPVPLGAAGRGLRLLSGRGLSGLLFTAAREPVAPGQPVLEDALGVHAADRVTSATPLFGVLGWPLSRTWSPVLHSTLLRRQGRPGLLVPLPVREADEARRVLARLGVEGAAVTMPLKTTIGSLATRHSDRCRRAGSVNSLRLASDGSWEADSFDGPAALRAMQRAGLPAGARLAVLGAGGAARALVAELSATGARAVVLARRDEAARDLAEAFGCDWAPLSDLPGLAVDAVVNATPAAPQAPLAGRLAFDMATTPPETDFLKTARARGLATVDGLTMFARQAAAQQRWWLGESALGSEETELLLRDIVDGRRDGHG